MGQDGTKPGQNDLGRKDDEGKQRYDLIAFDALGALVRVLTYGASRYNDRNWEKGIKYSRVFAANLRHLTAWWMREPYDLESKIHHLAHAMCCNMFLLAYELRQMYEWDDRPVHSAGIAALAGIEEERRNFKRIMECAQRAQKENSKSVS